jgi:hypothetical protein
MTATANIEIVGLKEAIRSLNKIEPGLRKEFVAQANAIAQPAINEAKAAYVAIPLSGMARKWTQNGRSIFPFSIAKAVSGVKLKVDASRNATSLIYITQTYLAAAVFETAGRKQQNRLGDALGRVQAGRTRLIGPAVYRKKNAIEREMEKAALATIARVQKELN